MGRREEFDKSNLVPEEKCPCFYGGSCPSNYEHLEDAEK